MGLAKSTFVDPLQSLRADAVDRGRHDVRVQKHVVGTAAAFFVNTTSGSRNTAVKSAWSKP